MSIVAACYVLYSLGVLVAPASSKPVYWARTNLHIVQHVPLVMSVVILLPHGIGQAQRLRGSSAALHCRVQQMLIAAGIVVRSKLPSSLSRMQFLLSAAPPTHQLQDCRWRGQQYWMLYCMSYRTTS